MALGLGLLADDGALYAEARAAGHPGIVKFLHPHYSRIRWMLIVAVFVLGHGAAFADTDLGDAVTDVHAAFAGMTILSSARM